MLKRLALLILLSCGVAFGQGTFPNTVTVSGSGTISLTTATHGNRVVLADCTGGDVVTIPTPDDTDFMWLIKRTNSAAGDCTIDPDGAVTIDGASTLVLTVQYQYIWLVSDGTNLHAIDASRTLGTLSMAWTAAHTFNPAPSFTGLTAGSILFCGTSCLVSQDNANLFWDDTAKRLQVGPRTGFITAQQFYVDAASHTLGSLNALSGAHRTNLSSVNEDNSTTIAHATVSTVESRNTSGTRSYTSGLEAYAFHDGTGGTVTQLVGMASFSQLVAGTVTNLIGTYINSNVKTAGAVTNNYGLLIENQASVGTNNWAIKTGTGDIQFGAVGALTCGAGTAGRLQFHTTPFQYCDNAATPTLQYAAYGNSAGAATSVAASTVGTSQITDGTVASADLATANKTRNFGILVGADNGAVLGDTDDQPTFWRAPVAVTITEVWCESDSGTPSINLQRDDGSAANILSSNLSCSTSGATGSIDGAEDNVAAGDKIDLVMVTAGGAAKRISVFVKYTVD